jgi:DNA polymerase III delta prime subunit
MKKIKSICMQIATLKKVIYWIYHIKGLRRWWLFLGTSPSCVGESTMSILTYSKLIFMHTWTGKNLNFVHLNLLQVDLHAHLNWLLLHAKNIYECSGPVGTIPNVNQLLLCIWMCWLSSYKKSKWTELSLASVMGQLQQNY